MGLKEEKKEIKGKRVKPIETLKVDDFKVKDTPLEKKPQDSTTDHHNEANSEEDLGTF